MPEEVEEFEIPVTDLDSILAECEVQQQAEDLRAARVRVAKDVLALPKQTPRIERAATLTLAQMRELVEKRYYSPDILERVIASKYLPSETQIEDAQNLNSTIHPGVRFSLNNALLTKMINSAVMDWMIQLRDTLQEADPHHHYRGFLGICNVNANYDKGGNACRYLAIYRQPRGFFRFAYQALNKIKSARNFLECFLFSLPYSPPKFHGTLLVETNLWIQLHELAQEDKTIVHIYRPEVANVCGDVMKHLQQKYKKTCDSLDVMLHYDPGNMVAQKIAVST